MIDKELRQSLRRGGSCVTVTWLEEVHFWQTHGKRRSMYDRHMVRGGPCVTDTWQGEVHVWQTHGKGRSMLVPCLSVTALMAEWDWWLSDHFLSCAAERSSHCLVNTMSCQHSVCLIFIFFYLYRIGNPINAEDWCLVKIQSVIFRHVLCKELKKCHNVGMTYIWNKIGFIIVSLNYFYYFLCNYF